MSLLTYDGIRLPYAYSTNYDQVPERDEVGGVDHYVTKFDIGVQCIINKSFLNYIAPRYSASRPVNAADLMNLVRQDLLRHRRAISYTVNGVDMIPGRTAGGGQGSNTSGTVDSKNGPQVQTCQILTLGEETFLLFFRVVTWWKENNLILEGVSPTTVNLPTNDVLFNRWTETVELDEFLYTKRIREGSYKIRSDSASAQQADMHRAGMAAVGVPVGFRRESSKYSISPDGLTIKYRVTDKEFFKVPPSPAYKASGEFTMSFVNMVSPVRYGEVRIRLEGGRFSNQAALLEKAWAVASQKLIINGAPVIKMKADDNATARVAMLAGGYWRVGMWDNWVEVNVRSMLLSDKSRLKGQMGNNLWVDTSSNRASFIRNMVQTPRCDPIVTRKAGINALEFPPDYDIRGSAWWLLQAAAYYDPAFLGVALSNSSAAELQAMTNPLIPGTGTWNNNGPQQIVPGVLVGKAGVQQE